MSDSCNEKPDLSFAFTGPTGPYVPPPPPECGTLDYSTSECAEHEAQYISNLMQEALNAAAGPVNVFPLLGVHSQGSTIDQIGSGYPLSSGSAPGTNIADGFNVNSQSWKSIQTGAAVTSTPAFIGYDFGTKKAWTAIGPGQERYSPSEPVRKKIASFKIKQGADPVNRVVQARIEASDDGVNWRRIQVVALPNSGALVTVGVNNNIPYNKWRIIPIFFNGVSANESWEVVQLEMMESTEISIEAIQDDIFLENRDRAYSRTSTMLKCQYDLLDVQTELAKFGINLPQTYIFTCSFNAMVNLLGRPVVVGDILELPGEVQYDHFLRPVRKWLEVTDTAWATEGYTMNWKPQLFKFYAQPIMPSVEHRDILGLPGKVNDLQTDDDIFNNGELQEDQAYLSTEAFKQASAEAVPQTGSDPQDLQSGMPLLGPPGGYDGNDLYVQDAIPPNGEEFTTGDTLPDGNTIDDGHWHRQTYTAVPAAIRPPDRLLRYNKSRDRWSVVEVNTRRKPESHKQTMSKIMGSSTKMNPDDKL